MNCNDTICLPDTQNISKHVIVLKRDVLEIGTWIALGNSFTPYSRLSLSTRHSADLSLSWLVRGTAFPDRIQSLQGQAEAGPVVQWQFNAAVSRVQSKQRDMCRMFQFSNLGREGFFLAYFFLFWNNKDSHMRPPCRACVYTVVASGLRWWCESTGTQLRQCTESGTRFSWCK